MMRSGEMIEYLGYSLKLTQLPVGAAAYTGSHVGPPLLLPMTNEIG